MTDVVEVLGLAPVAFLGIGGAGGLRVGRLVLALILARSGLGGHLHSRLGNDVIRSRRRGMR